MYFNKFVLCKSCVSEHKTMFAVQKVNHVLQALCKDSA